MRLSMIAAVARAEMRSVRRLARYWVFVLLSLNATISIYIYYAVIHGFLSRLSATVGAIGPRYLMPAMGIYLMVIFLLGLVFLAFDVRARDERDRMAEVLDVRPLSNAEFLTGRGLGLVLMAWAPVLLVAIVFQSFGALAVLLDWYLGEPVEPYSLAGFMLHSFAVFAAWCAAVVLLAVLIRNRLVVALVALGLVGFQLWLSFRMPLYLQPAFGVLFPSAPTTSDLVPSLVGGAGALRLGALLLLAAGLLAVATAFHPRWDGGSRPRRLAIGAALLAAAGVMIGTVAWQSRTVIDRRASWLAAHEARRQDVAPDVEAIAGTVRIDPGRAVHLDLRITARAPGDAPLDTLLFTFNPGLTVASVSAGGAEATWTHEAGLLEITPAGPVGPHGTTVALVASGVPDEAFAYLDSAIDLGSGTVMSANLALFGLLPGFFTSGYVALMPGQRWLPHAGSDVPSADPRVHPADPFAVDLEVEVPADWLVAGPGRREVVSSGGETARFRFRPGAPVTQVGLLASQFERRAMEVGGVALEILVHPGHDRNLRFFADASQAIADRVGTILSDAERLGLAYPYGGLSLVEAPTALRGYGGGWRMDTTQTMPGVLLLRENAFPTSRFEFEFRNPESFETREGGIAGAKVAALERYFDNDVSGGNLFLGASRNFLLFQTGARGEGALALDFVVDDLVNLLLTGKRGYFSPFLFGSGFNTSVGLVVTEMVAGRTDSIAQAVIAAVSDRPSVWDRALEVPLADLEPSDDAERTLNVLALKSHAIARSILDGLGREKTAALLAELLSRHRGGHFTAADFRQAAVDLGSDLQPLIGDWLHDAALPGFLTSPATVVRLADDAQGMPRYQTRVHVFNGEATPGLLRVRYVLGAEGSAVRLDQTAPARLGGHEAIEIGVVTSMPPREVWLQPYFSLNRDDFRVTLPRVDEQDLVKADPFVGVRPSAWRPSETDDIVVDDLDPGFAVESDEGASGFRLVATGIFAPASEMDEGLPEFNLPPGTGTPGEWSRIPAPSGWGRYRRTAAGVRSGSGARRAVFTASLPEAGRWRLAYHLPSGVIPALGAYHLTLHAGGEARPIEFDGAAAEGGWNALGEFELDAGEVRVEVSDETSGSLVIADAIRWQRAD